MTESQPSYFVIYKEPIEGFVVKRKCEHCGHDTEVGVETEDARFVPLKVGEKVKVTGIDVCAHNDDDRRFLIRTPSVPYLE